MTLESTKDLLYLILAFAVAWIAVFICWGLYELARLLRQANALVTDTRERVTRVERAVLSLKERLQSSAVSLGLLVEGGKSLLSFLQARKEKREKRGKK